jgi:hypothetical protein
MTTWFFILDCSDDRFKVLSRHRAKHVAFARLKKGHRCHAIFRLQKGLYHKISRWVTPYDQPGFFKEVDLASDLHRELLAKMETHQ